MTIQITPGRYRGLKTTSLAEKDVFCVLAFDQRGSYRRMMPEGTSFDELAQIKLEIIRELSKTSSAVLTDPIYGLDAAMHMSGQAGLLMALEITGYSGDATYRKIEFFEHWTPEKVRAFGSSAAKILVYYNPQQRALADELDDTLSEVIEKCHALDLPVFVEPICYSIDASISKDSREFADQKKDIVVETAHRLSRIGSDILKMEFPLDYKYNDNEADWVAACQEITDASTVPWALLSAGVDFETFERQFAAACQGGVSGFLAGRAIWKECVAMSPAERDEFLKTTGTDRLKRLIAIAETSATPWSDYYTVQTSTENWFEHYM
jgi:tagatose 1,6-diphosphate aldolase